MNRQEIIIRLTKKIAANLAPGGIGDRHGSGERWFTVLRRASEKGSA